MGNLAKYNESLFPWLINVLVVSNVLYCMYCTVLYCTVEHNRQSAK